MAIHISDTFSMTIYVFDEEQNKDIEILLEVDATYEYEEDKYTAADPGDCYPGYEEINIDNIRVISGTDKSIDELNLSENDYEYITEQAKQYLKNELEDREVDRYIDRKERDKY